MEHPIIEVPKRSIKKTTKTGKDFVDVAKSPNLLKTITESVVVHETNTKQYTDHLGIRNWQYQLTCEKL